MVKSKLDGTSDYTKLKKENEELKSKKIANKESVIAYINELEKKDTLKEEIEVIK